MNFQFQNFQNRHVLLYMTSLVDRSLRKCYGSFFEIFVHEMIVGLCLIYNYGQNLGT